MKNDYLCIKLLNTNQQIFRAISFGNVDLRNSSDDTIDEKEAIEKSRKSFNIEIDIEKCVRLVTLLSQCDQEELISKADIEFEEVIDLFNIFHNYNEQDLLSIGYIRNLLTGEIKPIIKEINNHIGLGKIFRVYDPYMPISVEQYILAGREDNAVKAYLRANNWLRKAKKENILYLKFLYYWIAIESVSKINQDEDITPKLRLVLGFPPKKFNYLFNNQFLSNLFQIKDYNKYKLYFFNKIKNARDKRNEIIHNGFRNQDIPDDELNIYIKILSHILKSMIGFLQKGILEGETELINIWEYMPLYIENSFNFLNYTKGTLFYNFKDDI